MVNGVVFFAVSPLSILDTVSKPNHTFSYGYRLDNRLSKRISQPFKQMILIPFRLLLRLL